MQMPIHILFTTPTIHIFPQSSTLTMYSAKHPPHQHHTNRIRGKERENIRRLHHLLRRRPPRQSLRATRPMTHEGMILRLARRPGRIHVRDIHVLSSLFESAFTDTLLLLQG